MNCTAKILNQLMNNTRNMCKKREAACSTPMKIKKAQNPEKGITKLTQ
jgi:hypothetical protein